MKPPWPWLHHAAWQAPSSHKQVDIGPNGSSATRCLYSRQIWPSEAGGTYGIAQTVQEPVRRNSNEMLSARALLASLLQACCSLPASSIMWLASTCLTTTGTNQIVIAACCFLRSTPATECAASSTMPRLKISHCHCTKTCCCQVHVSAGTPSGVEVPDAMAAQLASATR